MLLFIALAACGNDTGIAAIDAAGVGGPPGSPRVTVHGPRATESFYPSQTATIAWTATDEDAMFPCDVSVFGGASIATAVPTTSGVMTSSSWSINSATPGTYQIQVTCKDSGGLVGSGLSGTFGVSAPPQMVAYSTIQALWNRSCNSSQCHDAVMPQEGLDLTSSASYAELVDKASAQCPSTKLVEPGMPERSYLVAKLQGSGACFMGSRMPKPPAMMTAAEIQQVRDWIFNGATN